MLIIKSNEKGEVKVSLTIYGVQGFKIHPILQLLCQHFGENYTYNYIGNSPPEYKITDFIAGGFTTPVILHDTKIIEWKKTKFQQAHFVESKTLGKGLILDGITQYFERLTNYTNAFMKYVDSDSPKRILIIGGGDLVILKTIVKSPYFNNIESITLIEIDGEIVEASKRIFHSDFKEWMNDTKIEIIIDDANKRVLEMKKDKVFDFIIMDTTDPEILLSAKLFQKEFFRKLSKYHMSENAKIMLQYGLLEDQVKDIFDRDFAKKVKHPPSIEIFNSKLKVVYTPEYVGHTIFYIFSKKPHEFFQHSQNSTIDLNYQVNRYNLTFGNQISTVKHSLFPTDVIYSIEMFNASIDFELDSFKEKMIEIINFNSLKNQKVEIINESNTEEKVYIFSFNKIQIEIKSKKSLNSVLMKIKSNSTEFFVYNAIPMIIDILNGNKFEISQELFGESLKLESFYTKIQNGDIMAYSTANPTLFHNTKILEWKESDYHKILMIQNPILGKGMIINGMAEYFENAGKNYTDFIYSKVELLKPKNILIFGGDLSIITKIFRSEMFKKIDTITLVELDPEVILLSKKYLFPNQDEIFNHQKIQIIIKDSYEFIIDLDEKMKYDLIINDSEIPDESEIPEDFYEKIKMFHLSKTGEIG
eukprot:gene6871-11033_t